MWGRARGPQRIVPRWGTPPHRGLPRWGTFAERGKARSGKTPVRPLPVQGAIPATVGIALENPSPRARRPSPMFQHRGKARAPQSVRDGLAR